MLPLSLDVRLKSNDYPRAIVGIIAATAILHSFAEIYDAFAGADAHWDLLAFNTAKPNPLQFLLSIVSHAGWWHWFWNMFYLWVFGAALEDRLGWKKFLALFWICGVVGGLLDAGLFYWATWGEHGVQAHMSLGASGAIFGIMGLCQARFVKARMKVGLGPQVGSLIPILNWPVPVTWLCGYRLFIEVVMIGAGDGIGHMAHVLGFIVGLACGSLLGFEKESYDELVLNQAEDFAARGWWTDAIERYDRLLALKPRDGRIRDARLRCLYKLWPATRQADPRRKQDLLGELEKTLILYFGAKLPAEAVRLWRDFTPPYVLDDLNPKLRLQIEAHRDLVPAKAGQHLHMDDHAEHISQTEEELRAAGNGHDWPRVAELALDLYKVKDLKEWPLDTVSLGAQGLMLEKHLLGEELCQRLIRFGDHAQVVAAFLLLERAWKGTPKQAGFDALTVQAEAHCSALDDDQRYLDLKARLHRV